MNDKVYANYLMHGRTKGSRNGISTTKGYTAVGQKAKGHLVNGKYVYDYASTGSQNDWQQQAALEQWKKQNQNAIAAKKTAEAKAQVAKQPTNIGASQSADLARWKQQNRNNIAAKKEAALKEKLRRSAALNKYTTKDWQNKANIARANTEVRNKVVSGESNKGYTPYAEPGRVSNGIADEKTRNLVRLENLQNRVYAEQNKKAQEATEKANATKANATQMGLRNKVKAGAANNWQQNANKTAGIIGNMSREDRSLMKSKEWTSTDKDGTKKTNNSFNVNNKYGYSNYTKSDNGWHDVHMGEYNTTGVKGVKKQQDWNTSYERNHRSDIGNAVADAKADAKKAFKEAKADAKQAYVNLKNKFKKKKKK